ncbi:MAG: phosphonate utilization associated transcriptional regulator [Alphaproteobacteria bacterium]|nr:phosphonate utilization associated transcriptional regulator [Alphaproteobacteria bacterium]
MPSGDSPLRALKLVQSSSLPMLVQQEIERMILAGEIATGEWLNESALSQRFNISRGPVREAFRTLEKSGLVRQEKNRGVFVREVSVEEADQIYDLREALDELIGRQVAQRATASQIKELHALVDQMEEAARADDVAAYYSVDLRFHDVLAEFTGNRKLVAVYRQLINELHLFRLRGLAQLGGLSGSTGEHRAMVKLIEARKVDAAGRAFKQHVVASRRRMYIAYGLDKTGKPVKSERRSVRSRSNPGRRS